MGKKKLHKYSAEKKLDFFSKRNIVNFLLDGMPNKKHLEAFLFIELFHLNKRYVEWTGCLRPMLYNLQK